MKYRSRDPHLRDLEDARLIDATDHEGADPIIEWCGGERAGRPGMLVALKSWANIWMLGTTGDWVVLETGGNFRIWSPGEFERNYEAVEEIARPHPAETGVERGRASLP